ncbi:MAG: Uncharacterised protein [Cyanobium sp. ARS6]|nr:MAG: Uncharacterised protein [Cyanobium sp. ARS6]
MRADHRAEPHGSHHLRQSLFVHWITPGMHQSDGTTADAGLVMTNKPLHESVLEPQWLQFPAIRVQATVHLFDGSQQ